MSDAFICDAVRTPIGRYGGALASVRADDLGGDPAQGADGAQPAASTGAEVDDLIFGCANQAGEDNRNVGRMAVLLAGLPVDVPGTTINRLCGSGMDAVGQAARAIRAGDCELMLAGGVESMTRAPFVMPKAESAFSRSNAVYDTTIGWRFVNPKMKKEFGVDSMPQTADNVAADFSVSPRRPGRLRRPQPGALGRGPEGRQVPRRDRARRRSRRRRASRSSSTPTSIRAPAPPPRRWRSSRASTAPTSRVTAGNASGVNDGAAALVLASEAAAQAHGLTPQGPRRRHGGGRRRRRGSWASARRRRRSGCWRRPGSRSTRWT